MFVDEGDGLVDARNDLDGHFEGVVLRIEVLLRRGSNAAVERARLCIPHQLYLFCGEGVADLLHVSFGKAAVDDKALRRVADARALRLGVDEDGDRLVDVRRLFQIDMAVARARFDDGDGRVFEGAVDERLAPPRDEHVDEPLLPHEFARPFPRLVGDELDEGRIESARFQRLFDRCHDGDVGAQGVLAAAKDDGVAALDAEPDGVRRDVGAGFIDDPDDPERDADALDHDAGRRRVPLDDLPHGAGQRDELFQPLRDARDALLVEHEAVLKLRPARAGDNVLMIFGDDLCAVLDEGVRREREHFVLFFFRRIGDGVRPLFGEAAYFGNGHTFSSLQAVRQTARK